MIQARIIPCLLLHRGGLVKTMCFKKPRYVGDPINAVKIFNEKEVDELILLDIDATVENREPDYEMIEDIVSEAFMPVCYGGGIKTVDQMSRLFSLGVEKVSISSSAVKNPSLVKDASSHFGGQSVIVTLDVKKIGLLRRYSVVSHNANHNRGLDPVETAVRMEKMGAGELVINSVDEDGRMQGYDENLVKLISAVLNIPVVALGGAGSLNDLLTVVKKSGASAAAAGSLFVFKSVRRGVLINYPTQHELKKLFEVVV
ncbi:MAG: imidazole glycerol phosphate synthase subunit HisF [Sedimentisphaerales bacterium]|nr:imidazole glycerol phosphate synthase subunit HisF [Sedimentisphaerales bacterium]